MKIPKLLFPALLASLLAWPIQAMAFPISAVWYDIYGMINDGAGSGIHSGEIYRVLRDGRDIGTFEILSVSSTVSRGMFTATNPADKPLRIGDAIEKAAAPTPAQPSPPAPAETPAPAATPAETPAVPHESAPPPAAAPPMAPATETPPSSAITPEQAAVHYQNGVLLLNEGKYEEAVDALKLAVRGRPEDDMAHQMLGEAYVRLGKAEEARREMDIVAALRMNPQAAPPAVPAETPAAVPSETQNPTPPSAAAEPQSATVVPPPAEAKPAEPARPTNEVSPSNEQTPAWPVHSRQKKQTSNASPAPNEGAGAVAMTEPAVAPPPSGPAPSGPPPSEAPPSEPPPSQAQPSPPPPSEPEPSPAPPSPSPTPPTPSSSGVSSPNGEELLANATATECAPRAEIDFSRVDALLARLDQTHPGESSASSTSAMEAARTQEVMDALSQIDRRETDASRRFNAIGIILTHEGVYEEAVTWFNEAIDEAPREPMYFRNRAVALAKAQRFNEAMESAQRALKLGDPKADELIAAIVDVAKQAKEQTAPQLP